MKFILNNAALFHNIWQFIRFLNCSFTLLVFLTYITLLLNVGNYEQGDENRQLGAKLDDLKIDIEGNDDDDSGHHGVCYCLCLTFYIPLSPLVFLPSLFSPFDTTGQHI